MVSTFLGLGDIISKTLTIRPYTCVSVFFTVLTYILIRRENKNYSAVQYTTEEVRQPRSVLSLI